MIRALRHGGRESVLIDVGANIGMYSLAAAAAGFKAYAFEPVPMNVQMIIASAMRNRMERRLRIYTMGASDKFSSFHMGFDNTNQGGVNHTLDENAGFANDAVAPLHRVLPAVLAKAKIFVKMDIEGGECRALRGLVPFLRGGVRLLGAQVESGQAETIACCNELVTAPFGAFHVFHHVHRLCPFNAGNGTALAYAKICSDGLPWEIAWRACRSAPQSDDANLRRLMAASAPTPPGA